MEMNMISRGPAQIDVRFADVADGPIINALFNRVFREDRSLEEFDWKFRGSPWAGTVPPAIIGMVDGRLAAVFGLLPHRFWRVGEELTAVQVVDVCVDPEHRQEGIHRATLEFFLRHGGKFAQFAFGFPGPVYAQVGMEKLAYRLLSVVCAYAWEPGYKDQSDHKLLRAEITLDDAACLHQDWSNLLTACAQCNGISTQRTMDYIQWRYKTFSHRSHRFLTARRGATLEGVAVVRQPTADVRHGWRIFELLALSPEGVQKLLRHVIRQYSFESSRPVTYWCSESAPWQDELCQLGFRRINAGPAHAVGVPLGEPDPRVEGCFKAPNWFFTLGDSDL
jgi:hypothetical protein